MIHCRQSRVSGKPSEVTGSGARQTLGEPTMTVTMGSRTAVPLGQSKGEDREMDAAADEMSAQVACHCARLAS
jgi:hypothetical protein